jgi:hypothetical protein
VLYVGDGGLVITGRSMDWGEDMHSNLWLFPRGQKRDGATGPNSVTWISKYGSLGVSAYDAGIADGMNEKGLVMNGLYLAESNYGRPDGRPTMSVMIAGQYVLDNFATVAEAVDALRGDSFRIVAPTLPNGKAATVHMSLSDSTGDSAIFEWLDGELVIHHGKDYRVLIVVMGNWVKQIPMAALTAVMIMVSISTFKWSSMTNLRSNPLSSSTVMLATVVAVVATHDLSIGVLTGVVLSGIFFAAKVARLLGISTERSEDGKQITYIVSGQVFFASSTSFIDAFDYTDVPERVRIDVSAAHFWDITAIGALDDIVLKLRRHGAQVDVVGLNQASATMVERFGTHHRADAQPRPVH